MLLNRRALLALAGAFSTRGIAAEFHAGAARPTLGLIFPPADRDVPEEGLALYGDRVEFLVEGLGLKTMTPEGYDAVLDRIPLAAKRLAERGAQAITLMGTSLSFYQGSAFNLELTQAIRAAVSLPAVTMSTAVAEGLRAVDARRVACATAYNDDVNHRLHTFLHQQGFEVLVTTGLGIEKVEDVETVTHAQLLEFCAGVFASASDADAVLVSCGGLRTLELLAPLEDRCGVPVVSSTPHALRAGVKLLGIDSTATGFGSLIAA